MKLNYLCYFITIIYYRMRIVNAMDIWYSSMTVSDSNWVSEAGSYSTQYNNRCPGSTKQCWSLASNSRITRTVSTLGMVDIQLQWMLNSWHLGSNEHCIIDYTVDGTNTYTIADNSIDGSGTYSSWRVDVNNQPALTIRILSQNTADCYYAQFRLTGVLAPTSAPTNSPTDSTQSPSLSPTHSTSSPTKSPSPAPTVSPTNSPSPSPTKAPTPSPTPPPTFDPTQAPTSPPTQAPSFSPIDAPTQAPFDAPSMAPTDAPSTAPSTSPSDAPSIAPTHAPSAAPSRSPSNAPSDAPSDVPSLAPSTSPSDVPSIAPTHAPSAAPSRSPSNAPSDAPSDVPSLAPSTSPSDVPSIAPTHAPSNAPSTAPTQPPSRSPSNAPSMAPTSSPSESPSFSPTTSPSNTPTQPPTTSPSNAPTQSPTDPTMSPSNSPTAPPTNAPTSPPTNAPTSGPTQPTSAPTTPTVVPTNAPTAWTVAPSRAPTEATLQPSMSPTTSYGFIIRIAFEYQLHNMSVMSFERRLESITHDMIADMTSEYVDCIAWMDWTVSVSPGDNLAMVNGSIFVCDRDAQRTLMRYFKEHLYDRFVALFDTETRFTVVVESIETEVYDPNQADAKEEMESWVLGSMIGSIALVITVAVVCFVIVLWRKKRRPKRRETAMSTDVTNPDVIWTMPERVTHVHALSASEDHQSESGNARAIELELQNTTDRRQIKQEKETVEEIVMDVGSNRTYNDAVLTHVDNDVWNQPNELNAMDEVQMQTNVVNNEYGVYEDESDNEASDGSSDGMYVQMEVNVPTVR
eukprot:666005_1